NDSLWSQTYEFGNMPWIYFTWGICETPAGNFIIAADKAVGDEILVFEIDPDGELLWSNIWTEDNLVSARDIIPVPSGGYVIAGAQYGGVTVPYYLRLMRLDEAGDSLWTRIYEPWAECDGHCVLTTADGGFVLIGETREILGDPDDQITIIRTDSLGNPVWSRRYGGSSTDWGTGAILTSDERIIVTGLAYPDAAVGSAGQVMCISPEGDSLWTVLVDTEDRERFEVITALPDGGFAVGGMHANRPECFYMQDWVVRFESVDFTPRDNRMIPEVFTLYPAYPNPFNPTTTLSFDLTHPGMVKLNVFDVIGRLVTTLVDDNLTAGKHEVMFDGSEQASGIYFYRLQAGEQMQTQKMVLLK
ncbi:T9SS type A sorting domain-containing protein, partial [bacterium]|nr:T9SS type A sorting domain-containing protein [bacterium]